MSVAPSSPLREPSGLAPRRVRPDFLAGSGDDHGVQQALLLGDLHLSERRVRELVTGAEWADTNL